MPAKRPPAYRKIPSPARSAGNAPAHAPTNTTLRTSSSRPTVQGMNRAQQRPQGVKTSGTFKSKITAAIGHAATTAISNAVTNYGGGSSNLVPIPQSQGMHFGIRKKHHKKLGISNADLKSLVRVAKVIKLVSQVTHTKHHMKLKTHRKRSY